MNLWARVIKTVTIAVLSLVVAVITFGVLGSTGAFKNSAYDLGGSIVGFLATGLLLKKIFEWDPPGKIAADESEEGPFFSDDTVQILDMRNQKPVPQGTKSQVKNRVVLTEHYRLWKRADASELVFNYATYGESMEGSCISLGLNEKLKDTTGNPVSEDEGKHLKRQYEIRLNVQDVPTGKLIDVHNVVTYISAFDGQESEWFHTHVNFPTKSKCIILLFPDGQPCLNVKGLEKIGTDDEHEVDRLRVEPPLILNERKVVYWRIDNPLPGPKYRLKWEWQNIDTTATKASTV